MRLIIYAGITDEVGGRNRFSLKIGVEWTGRARLRPAIFHDGRGGINAFGNRDYYWLAKA